MARVKGQLKYSGSIQDTTFYSLPGSDAVFARMKSGPSKRRMKEDDEFATNGFAGLIEPVNNASAAKILLAESAIANSSSGH
jgi:hypothetical protein